jgi:hypothetical protein
MQGSIRHRSRTYQFSLYSPKISTALALATQGIIDHLLTSHENQKLDTQTATQQHQRPLNRMPLDRRSIHRVLADIEPRHILPPQYSNNNQLLFLLVHAPLVVSDDTIALPSGKSLTTPVVTL